MRLSMKRLVLAILLTTTIVLGGCGGASAPVADAPVVQPVQLELAANIDAATVDEIRGRDDVFIVDVREDYEYADGHIPGAVLIPLGQLPNRLSELPEDKTIVAVCRSGNRSGQATQFLNQQGFDIHNMQGGMNSWKQAGLEIEQ
ncbi:MAG: rhodanese-like domain-containing protein [Chloroflexota bacterium]|nr:rhodanese-like domain-containing protein [Chloroflexota bacterium]